VPRVYGIADADALGGLDRLPAAVREMAEAGIEWIQWRAKGPRDDRALYDSLACTLAALAGTPARLWVNDRADLALALRVFGLHLGQSDLPAQAVRALAGERLVLGCSTHDTEQLSRAAEDAAADVLAVGPVFATTGKSAPDRAVGIEFVRRARLRTAKPLVAIGGIGAANARQVLDAGADCVAVLGALCRGWVRANCEAMLAAVR
jgi:thiamine-phosphate pyrophosphorylase